MTYTQMFYAVGTWGTISNCFFFFAAIFSDLILIRFSLTMAYIMLLINALNGLPSIPHWTSDAGLLPWGFVFWSVLCGTLHCTALVRHWWDERPIKLSGDTEQLWRCMYRRSGMGKIEFLELMKRGTWNSYKKGETIYLKGFSELCLHMIVDGVVSVCSESSRSDWWPLYSGEMFDFRLFNLFGIYIGFDRMDGALYQVDADTDCLLFTWHASQVSDMAFAVSPSVSGYWRNLILYMVGSGFTRRRRHVQGQKCSAHDSNGLEEDPAWLKGARTRDMTSPMQASELQSYSLRSWAAWVWRSLSLFPPVGLRHRSLPGSGMRAAARTMAFANQDHIIARFQSAGILAASPLHLVPDHPAPGSPESPRPTPLRGVAPMVVRFSSREESGHGHTSPVAPSLHPAEISLSRPKRPSRAMSSPLEHTYEVHKPTGLYAPQWHQ